MRRAAFRATPPKKTRGLALPDKNFERHHIRTNGNFSFSIYYCILARFSVRTLDGGYGMVWISNMRGGIGGGLGGGEKLKNMEKFVEMIN